jgi:translation initiation factor IF-3
LGISNVVHQINDDIRDREVRLIGEDGEQLGIMSIIDAMNIAIEQDLDLVKIAPGSKPPVCKVMDYGKYRFEQQKREKEAKKNQHIVEIKEIRMSPSIGQRDFEVKLRNGLTFLSEGDRLKVTVRFRGREMAHTKLGEELLMRFAKDCDSHASLDRNPKLDGRHMTIFLSPKAPVPEKQ